MERCARVGLSPPFCVKIVSRGGSRVFTRWGWHRRFPYPRIPRAAACCAHGNAHRSGSVVGNLWIGLKEAARSSTIFDRGASAFGRRNCQARNSAAARYHGGYMDAHDPALRHVLKLTANDVVRLRAALRADGVDDQRFSGVDMATMARSTARLLALVTIQVSDSLTAMYDQTYPVPSQVP